MNTLKGDYKRAINCKSCFENTELVRGKVKKAQPRWVGEDYFLSNKKICILMISPGDVGPKTRFARQQASSDFENLIQGLEEGSASWEEAMLFILNDMPNWGQGGKYNKLYFDHLKLPLKEIAFLNVMLCSARKKDPRGKFQNYYSQQTMRNCFINHTHNLLKDLDPDICILSGTAVWEFAKRANLNFLFPDCEFKELGHYAARGNDWNKVVKTAHVISSELQLMVAR
jgi:hypothetical protein